MPAELLEFEEPVGVLLKEIEALSMLPQTPERMRSIDTLRKRGGTLREDQLVDPKNPRWTLPGKAPVVCGK